MIIVTNNGVSIKFAFTIIMLHFNFLIFTVADRFGKANECVISKPGKKEKTSTIQTARKIL